MQIAVTYQELRRWRRQAAELVHGQDHLPPSPSRRTPPPRTAPPSTFRSPLPATTEIGTGEAPGASGLAPPPCTLQGDGDRRAISVRLRACGRGAEVDQGLRPRWKEGYAEPVEGDPGKDWIEWSRLKNGGTADRGKKRYPDRHGAQGGALTVGHIDSRSSTQARDQRYRSDDVVVKDFDGHRGQCYDSKEDQSVATVPRSELREGVRGRKGKGAGQDEVGLSLDLSDCSDEVGSKTLSACENYNSLLRVFDQERMRNGCVRRESTSSVERIQEDTTSRFSLGLLGKHAFSVRHVECRHT